MVERLAEILETYRGREKIIRLTAYSCCFVGGILRNTRLTSLAKSLTVFSDSLNETRTVLRLFDDVSMFVHCKGYGLGAKDENLFLRLTTLIDNFFGQAYYPVEHIAWARDQKLISGQSNNLWTLGILLWLGSLCVSVAQSLWLLRKLKKEEEIWRKQRRKSHQGQKSEVSDDQTQSTTSIRPIVDRQLQEARYIQDHKLWYKAKERQLIITAIGSLADAGNAVHWLPPGFLWAGTFNQMVVGLLGTISSGTMLYNYLNPVKDLKEKFS